MLPVFLGAAPELLARAGFSIAAKSRPKDGSSRVRNLFHRADPSELGPGHAATPEQQAAVRERLRKLAAHMQHRIWPGGGSRDNPTIPAGYTYLAQLAAHDLVHTIAPLPRLGEPTDYFARDFRSNRLLLDTIYGGGPMATSLPFAIDERPWRQRHDLRLGHVPGSEGGFANPHPAPMDDQPARDIGRAACPHLQDKPGIGVPDALLADPRNDDHLILSQLTALFHELHNIVYAKLAAAGGGSGQDDFRSYRLFLEARKVVTLAWRKVIVNDLLRRLLEPAVYAFYSSPQTRYPDDFLDASDDGRVPVEFSHAAYRFGHVMIRFSYVLNDLRRNGPVPETASIGEILDRSSSRKPWKVPVACNWLVDWSRFFDLGQRPPQELNFSHRLRPEIGHGGLASDTFFPNEDAADGGLFFRDLVRGADAGVRSVASLIAGLRPSDRQRSQLLADPNFREHAIGLWLRLGPTHNFSADDETSLSQDPPLFFFVLFEAAHEQNGERLGILGSTIVAEVFFAAIRQSRSTIEDDATLAPAVAAVFGNAVPGDMPALISFMQQNGGLKNVTCA